MVLITGYGMITALGDSVAANKEGLLNRRQALFPPEVLHTRHGLLPVGEIKLSDKALLEKLKIKNKKYNRSTLLGIHALEETLGFLPPEVRTQRRVAFINATTVGGMNEVEKYYPDMISENEDIAFREVAAASDCAGCTHDLASFFDFKGFQATISTACSSSANTLLLGARMIENGETDIAICGGTDALSTFTLNGFNSLKNIDKALCRPFDQNRNGLNLGEGAAYLVLESEKSAHERKAKPMATFPGFGNTNEAYHPTAPSPDGAGALRTMKAALEKAGIRPEAIGYVNAHGTATLGNDLSEGSAIQSLFGRENAPPFSSIKAFTGHTLAASGAVAAIVSCLCLQHHFIPPNLRFETPMEELDIRPQPVLLENISLNYVLTNSFGFGGNNVALIFGK
jgi:3-oxoacyl-[acyl-carrier-protein] synthase-1